MEGTLRASMDRDCVVTGERFPFEFKAEFSTYIKVCVCVQLDSVVVCVYIQVCGQCVYFMYMEV